MKTKFKVLIVLGITLLSILIYLSVLLLSDSKPKLSSNVPNDIIYNIIHTKSNELTLGNDEINSLIKLLVKNKTVKDTEVMMQKDKITFNVYCNYKKINFLLCAKGSLNYSKNQLIFTPEWFKIGRFTVPKSIAFYFMKNYSNEYIKFLNNGDIALSTDIMQTKISALNIADGKMHIFLSKEILKDNSKIASTDSTTSTASKNNSNITGNNPYSYNSSNNNNNNSKSNNQVEYNTPNQQKNSTTQLLQSVSCQLGDAIAHTSNANEKNILCKIQYSINNVLNNPKYNFNNDIKDINHDYASLTVSERKNLQFIILGTVDIQNLNKLKNIFGNSIP